MISSQGIGRIDPKWLYVFWMLALLWAILWVILVLGGFVLNLLFLMLDVWVLMISPLFVFTWLWLVKRAPERISRISRGIVLFWMVLHLNPVDLTTLLDMNRGSVGRPIVLFFIFLVLIFPFFTIVSMMTEIFSVARLSNGSLKEE